MDDLPTCSCGVRLKRRDREDEKIECTGCYQLFFDFRGE